MKDFNRNSRTLNKSSSSFYFGSKRKSPLNSQSTNDTFLFKSTSREHITPRQLFSNNISLTNREKNKAINYTNEYYFFVLRDKEKGEFLNDDTENQLNELLKKLSLWEIDYTDTRNKLKLQPFHSIKEAQDDIPPILQPLNLTSIIQGDIAQIKTVNRKSSSVNDDNYKESDKQDIKAKAQSLLKFNIFHQLPLIPKDNESMNSSNEVNLNQEIDQQKYYRHHYKEQSKVENIHRDNLMRLYYKSIILKMKKIKYQSILDDTFRLLEDSRQESLLLIDILKDRKKAVDKTYQDFITNPINPLKKLEDEEEEQQRLELKQKQSEEVSQIESSRSRTRLRRNDSTRTIMQSSHSGSTFNKDNTKKPSNDHLQYFRRKKKTQLEIFDEKVKIHHQYIEIIQDLDSKIKRHEDHFNEIKQELNVMIQKNQEEVTISNQRYLYYKIEFQSQCKIQTSYYLNILKEGVDGRNEGLTWVIRRLLELNVFLSNNCFPNFLDSEQIEFLMILSKMGYELYQLKIILKTLKVRQGKLIDHEHQSQMKELNKYIIMKKTEIKNEQARELNGEVVKDKVIERLRDKYKIILDKQQDIFKLQFENKIEKKRIENMIKGIKYKLVEYAAGKNVELVEQDHTTQWLLKQEEQKAYYDDILILTKRINELEEMTKTLIKDQLQSFQRKFFFMQSKLNNKAATYYDTVYKALFGIKVIPVHEH